MLHISFVLLAVCAAVFAKTELLFRILLLPATYLVCGLLWLLFLAVLALFIRRDKPAGRHWRTFRRIAEQTLIWVLHLLGIRIRLTGEEKMPCEGRFLYICNHVSNFDPMVGMVALRGHDVTFISKKQNIALPVVGRLIHAAGVLSIDQENDRAAVRTVIQAVRYIKEDRTSIAVYPEGHRRKTREDCLLPFRDGCFKIAQKADVPIVVSAIRGTESVMRNFCRFRRTEVTVDVLSVIPASEVKEKTTHELGEKIWNEMHGYLRSKNFS